VHVLKDVSVCCVSLDTVYTYLTTYFADNRFLPKAEGCGIS